ncbi:MAG TPA: hypothetical protein VGQ83_05940 [Polyangia bacterium]|jgi:hypothetical protein
MKSRIALLAVMTAIAAGAVGCTHVMQIGLATSPARVTRSAGKRVAVVFQEPGFKGRYESSTDGFTYVLEHAPGPFIAALQGALRGVVAEVAVFRGRPDRSFDAYIYPMLELQITTSFVVKTCTARYTLVVTDATGREIARRTEVGQHRFTAVVASGGACATALQEPFDTVTAWVLPALDRF